MSSDSVEAQISGAIEALDNESGFVTAEKDGTKMMFRYRLHGSGRGRRLSFFETNPDGTLKQDEEGKPKPEVWSRTRPRDIQTEVCSMLKVATSSVNITPDGIKLPTLKNADYAGQMRDRVVSSGGFDAIKPYIAWQLRQRGGAGKVEEVRAMLRFEHDIALKEGDAKKAELITGAFSGIDGLANEKQASEEESAFIKRARSGETSLPLKEAELEGWNSYNAYVGGRYIHNGGLYSRTDYAALLQRAAMKAFEKDGTLEAAMAAYDMLSKTGGGGKNMLSEAGEREAFERALMNDLIATGRMEDPLKKQEQVQARKPWWAPGARDQYMRGGAVSDELSRIAGLRFGPERITLFNLHKRTSEKLTGLGELSEQILEEIGFVPRDAQSVMSKMEEIRRELDDVARLIQQEDTAQADLELQTRILQYQERYIDEYFIPTREYLRSLPPQTESLGTQRSRPNERTPKPRAENDEIPQTPEFLETKRIYAEVMNELEILATRVMPEGGTPPDKMRIPSEFLEQALFEKNVSREDIDRYVAILEQIPNSINGFMRDVAEDPNPSREYQNTFSGRLEEFKVARDDVREMNARLNGEVLERVRPVIEKGSLISDEALDALIAKYRRT